MTPLRVPHTAPNPFPFRERETGRLVAVDEQCMCRHLRSEHYDTVAYGHGDCGRCDCQKFSWHSFKKEIDG
jgi:hypothetical protein